MKESVININKFLVIRDKLRKSGKKIVFTNGCFDILHAGHVDYLNKAKECGDVLVVGLNSNTSVQLIKGTKRPIVDEVERAFILKNLKSVDYVILFDEPTPLRLIEKIIPDVLVKGSDWSLDNIVGKDVVEKNGGKVVTIDFITPQSTTNIVKKVLDSYNE